MGAQDDGTWLQALSDLNPEDIGRGLMICAKQVSAGNEQWPPGWPAFRARCQITPQPKRLIPQIKQAPRDVAERYLEECWQIIGKTRPKMIGGSSDR